MNINNATHDGIKLIWTCFVLLSHSIAPSHSSSKFIFVHNVWCFFFIPRRSGENWLNIEWSGLRAHERIVKNASYVWQSETGIMKTTEVDKKKNRIRESMSKCKWTWFRKIRDLFVECICGRWIERRYKQNNWIKKKKTAVIAICFGNAVERDFGWKFKSDWECEKKRGKIRWIVC